MPSTYYTIKEIKDKLIASGATDKQVKVVDEPIAQKNTLFTFSRPLVDIDDTCKEEYIDSITNLNGEYGRRGELTSRECYDGLQKLFSLFPKYNYIEVLISW